MNNTGGFQSSKSSDMNVKRLARIQNVVNGLFKEIQTAYSPCNIDDKYIKDIEEVNACIGELHEQIKRIKMRRLSEDKPSMVNEEEFKDFEQPVPEENVVVETAPSVKKILPTAGDLFDLVEKLRMQNPQYFEYSLASRKLEYSSNPSARYIRHQNYVLPNQIRGFSCAKIDNDVYRCNMSSVMSSYKVTFAEMDDSGRIIKVGEICE